jgi:transposase
MVMAISLPDARQLSDEALQVLRWRALRGVEMGYTETDLAELLGVCRETISRWWSAYASDGEHALPQKRTGHPLGLGRLLSDEQASRIQQLINENTPDALGIHHVLWTSRAIRDLIRQETGVELAERTVRAYLQRWGYTSKKPRRHCRKQDPDELEEWLEKTYPLIEQRAQEEQAEILWCDETGVEADHHPGCGYAPRGEPSTMEVPAPHIRMNQMSAISNEGTVRFMTYKGTMNAALFLVFLGRLLQSTSGKLFVIADRLRAHDTLEVWNWLERHKERIALFYLPPYSPEENPVEYLNNDLKGNVNEAGLPEDKPTLRSRMRGFMRKLLNVPEHVMNYFLHPSVQYAAGIEV